MGLYQKFKTDERLEKEGVWVEYGEDESGLPIRFLIARAGGANKRFTMLVEKKMRPYRRALSTGTLDNATALSVMRECFAEAVILDWENVTDENGEILPYSQHACLKLLTDLPDLFADIRQVAESMSAYKEELREADQGN